VTTTSSSCDFKERFLTDISALEEGRRGKRLRGEG